MEKKQCPPPIPPDPTQQPVHPQPAAPKSAPMHTPPPNPGRPAGPTSGNPPKKTNLKLILIIAGALVLACVIITLFLTGVFDSLIGGKKVKHHYRDRGGRYNEEIEEVAVVEEEAPSEAYPANISIYDFDEAPTYLSYRKLEYSDIMHLSSDELRILRNSIYAMHGRRFQSDELREYFSRCTWYYPRYDEISDLNEIEQYNIKFIQQYE